MRLARMNGTQALERGAQAGGALVNEEVAEAIVRFIAAALSCAMPRSNRRCCR